MTSTRECKCTKCGVSKPHTTKFFRTRGRRDGSVELRRQCKSCRSYATAETAREPGPKPCVNCHDMPWRVAGIRCRCCGLEWGREPKPELVLRKFDRVG